MVRSVYAQQLSRLGGRAIFCRHSFFLGALGSLAHSEALGIHVVDNEDDVWGVEDSDVEAEFGEWRRETISLFISV